MSLPTTPTVPVCDKCMSSRTSSGVGVTLAPQTPVYRRPCSSSAKVSCPTTLPWPAAQVRACTSCWHVHHFSYYPSCCSSRLQVGRLHRCQEAYFTGTKVPSSCGERWCYAEVELHGKLGWVPDRPCGSKTPRVRAPSACTGGCRHRWPCAGHVKSEQPASRITSHPVYNQSLHSCLGHCIAALPSYCGARQAGVYIEYDSLSSAPNEGVTSGVNSYRECCELCRAAKGCAAFMFDAHDGVCYLKDMPSSPYIKKRDGFDSGFIGRPCKPPQEGCQWCQPNEYARDACLICKKGLALNVTFEGPFDLQVSSSRPWVIMGAHALVVCTG